MNSLDASTAADLRPIAEVLADLKQLADNQKVGIMVVGAVARDILIRHGVGTMPGRATADVDVAVAVSSWSEVRQLTGTLQAVDASGHKFLVRGTEVDFIPFGGIESDRRTIMWPSDHLMNVFGFSEALNSAVTVSLPGSLQIAVASLPAQSLLKLFAWRDRRYHNRRDAIDLGSILSAFHEGFYREQLYEEYLRLLEKHDFDDRLAGAERMGEDARQMVGRHDRHIVVDLLTDDELMTQLAADMSHRPAEDRARLAAYRDGFVGA